MVSSGWLLNRSGGLFYHYLYLRYGRTLWRPYQQFIHRHLQQWTPGGGHLVLLGPSGGYSLPAQWLACFDRVDAIDFDPLAERIFKWRFPNAKVVWHRTNFLGQSEFYPQGLLDLKKQFSGDYFLFCNFLGQLPFLYQDYESQHEVFKNTLYEFCQDSNWCSYHDIYSVSLAAASGDDNFLSQEVESVESWLEAMARRQEEKGDHSARIINDHWTKSLLPKAEKPAYVSWALQPRSRHLIEFVCQPARSSINSQRTRTIF